MVKTPSITNKLLLLLWKNFTIQIRRIIGTILTILIPILLSLLIIPIRQKIKPKEITKATLYPSYPINLKYLTAGQNPKTPGPIEDYILLIEPSDQIILDIGYLAVNNSELEKLYLCFDSTCRHQFPYYYHRFLVKFIVPKDIAVIPKNIIYSITFPSELRMYSSEYVQFWNTQFLYPEEYLAGPRNPELTHGGEPGYLREGFLAIQHELANAVFAKICEKQHIPYTLIEVHMRRFPYPPYFQDDFSKYVDVFVPLVFIFGYVHLGTQTVKDIGKEKEKHLKELMIIMGIPNWLHWCAWFIKSFILMAISMTIIIILYVIKFNGISVIQYSSVICILIFCYAYCTATITYLFMITTFFSSAKTASAMNGLIWFLFFLPFAYTSALYQNLNLAEKLFLSLFHNTAMGYGLRLIFQFESIREGLQLKNLFRPIEGDNLSVGLIILMMLISSILYMLITLYIEKIYPRGRHRLSEPEKWNFPFKKNFWVKKKSHDNKIENIGDSANDKKIGVSIENLSKNYGSQKAVENLSMNLFENEITVLLGENGAGKTTVIYMLTGIIAPTSGTAVVNGSDIRKDVAGVRKSIGLCPQYNILFDELTVREHIIFYSRVKGLKSKEIKNEVIKYVKILQLQKKKNTLSKKLSGGMKRNLSVVCALCGNSKVVFLDEPSSGMDPASRLVLWDTLQAEKQNRTILLSTHFMDEADAVSDRIAMMSSGNLKSYDTSISLKNTNGTYNLVCVKNEYCKPEEVTAYIRNFIPKIQLGRDTGKELSYKLPVSELAKFGKMLADLEKNSQKLNIESYGFSNGSLEDVFKEEKQDNNEVKNLDPCSIELTKGTFIVTMLRQFKAMFLKRFLCTIRNYKIFLIPFGVIIFLLLFILLIFSTGPCPLPSLLITFHSYPEAITVIELKQPSDNARNMAKDYEKYIKSHGKNYKVIYITESFNDYILKQDLAQVNLKYLIAVTFDGDIIHAWFNNQLLHTAPLSLNIVHNAILRQISPDSNINVINYPGPKRLPTWEKEHHLDSDFSSSINIALSLCILLSFVTSFYILFIIKERESRAKLLQFVSGVRVPIFWLTHFIFDYIIFILLTILIIIILICFKVEGFNTVGDLGRSTLILLFFGLAIIPFIYLFSLLFNQPITGFCYIFLFNILCGIILCVTHIYILFRIMFLAAIFIIVILIREIDKKELATTLHYIFLMFPVYALATGINNLNSISRKTKLCKELCTGFEIWPCKLEYICEAEVLCCLSDYFEYDSGIAWNLIYLSITCLLCLTLLMLFTLRFVKELFQIPVIKIKLNSKSKKYGDTNIDDDVKEESQRIAKMSKHEIESYNLILKKVTKYQGTFLAVKKISVAINPSECLGILDVNGTGNTTLFKVLIGDEITTFGKVLVKGNSLKFNSNKVYRNIGYCKQSDVLFEELTGREILKIFCLLRGTPKNQIKDITSEMATLLDYTKYIDKRYGSYSDGNKRKLINSIAILGCPSVILLDEPTNGMDPGAKRKFWNVIHSMRSAGTSIVLSSRSMEECEALCTRLAIMVNGELKFIGSTQDIKNKLAKDFILTIKAKNNLLNLKSHLLVEDEYNKNVDLIANFIEKEFTNAVLEERYQDTLVYKIPLTAAKLSEVFSIIETKKTTLFIEDYTISQTLDQIF